MSKTSDAGFLLSVVKSVLISVVFVLIGVLIFALLIKIFGFTSSVIRPTNQVIKVLSLFCGVMLCIRGEKGLIKGATVGIFSTVLTYFLFALLGGEGLFNISFILDVIFGAVIGAISGVISVNVRKSV